MINKINQGRMYEIIRRPKVTEKTALLSSQNNQYTFVVSPDATKSEVKLAIEKLFNVKVKAVNTLISKGKVKTVRGIRGVRNDVKKAVVTLEDGQSLDLSTGV